MRSSEVVRSALTEVSATLRAVLGDPTLLEAVDRFVELAHAALSHDGRLMVCGNGGSMAQAMHFAEEWTGRFRADRGPLPAMAFSDPAVLSCIANDFGYDEVFARQLGAHGRPGDLLVLLSTSGGSTNLVRAVEEARALRVATVGLLGRGGGKLLDCVDVAIVVPHATKPDRVQEIHAMLLHAVTEAVERRIAPHLYEPGR
jgi:D-sedoheptulose 7-phosphate isomerase